MCDLFHDVMHLKGGGMECGYGRPIAFDATIFFRVIPPGRGSVLENEIPLLNIAERRSAYPINFVVPPTALFKPGAAKAIGVSHTI